MSYIVKEDLLEELGISTDCSTCPRYAGECRGHLSWLCGKIDRMPTHDVVRCKDCKRSSDEYKTKDGVWKTDDNHLFCKMTNHLMRIGDFCSWGERREDEAD